MPQVKVMKISICGDSENDYISLHSMLGRRLSDLCVSADLITYDNIGMLLANLDAADRFVFLDADSKRFDSLEVARQIRERGYEIPIIFHSSSAEKALDCYSVYPSSYLVKPIEYSKLCKAIDWYRVTFTESLRRLDIVSSRIPLSPFLADILYIEVQERFCVIYTNAGSFKTNQTLSVVMEQLDEAPFFRCHRSFIVNLLYLAGGGADEIILSDGSRVPVSFDYQDHLSELTKTFTAMLGANVAGWE